MYNRSSLRIRKLQRYSVFDGRVQISEICMNFSERAFEFIWTKDL